jgi:hypothetical protein
MTVTVQDTFMQGDSCIRRSWALHNALHFCQESRPSRRSGKCSACRACLGVCLVFALNGLLSVVR